MNFIVKTSLAIVLSLATLTQAKTRIPTPASLVPSNAGKHGFLTINPQTKRLMFEDGTPARFYGVCFQTYLEATSPISDEDMTTLLDDLKEMGVNVIRFQTHTSKMQDGSLGEKINPVSLDNRDRFFAHAIKRGIYLHMNLHTRGYGQQLAKKYGGNSECIVMIDDIIEMNNKFVSDMLNHVNPHTGRAYKDEPAIISLQLGNEHHTYSREGWRNKYERHTGPIKEEVQRKFNRFLKDKYASREALAKAWGELLKDGEDPAKGNVPVCNPYVRTWKDKRDPNAKESDMVLFCDAMQDRYHKIMRDLIRNKIGDKKHLISDNGWIRGDRLMRQTAHANLDLMDLQHYWPHGPRWRLSEKDAFAVSTIKDMGISILASMNTAREFDGVKKPGFITEYNSHMDNQYAWELYPVHAVMCNLTGIDGTTVWLYQSDSRPVWWSADHWFSFNRVHSDVRERLIPFVLGAYLARVDVKEEIDSAKLKELAKRVDEGKAKGLSVDFDASLEEKLAAKSYVSSDEQVTIDFPQGTMLLNTPKAIFHVGSGSFKHPIFTFTPYNTDERYCIGLFALDGQSFEDAKIIRVFSITDGAFNMPGFAGKWQGYNRFNKASRRSSDDVANQWTLDRAPNILYFDLIRN
ncbi:MAG: cellulase family glycosylhydrolase [Phycisphaeraceae bacterium JB051]